MKIFKITSDYENMRLDRYLLKQARFLSKAQIEKMIRKGDVKLNDKKTYASTRLKTGDSVYVYSLNDTQNIMYKANLSLPKPDIFYEDDFLLAVNKPAFLPSQSAKKGEDSLNERIRAYLYESAKAYDGAFIPGIANRLDTNTSGIVLCAKTPIAASELSALIKNNKIDKHYYTLVCGKFDKKQKYTCYGKKDHEKNIMIISETPVKDYVKMTSVFTPLRYINGYTLLDVKLITGKTHQIRSQLSELSYPVAGDYKYGIPSVNRQLEKTIQLKRQFLHAYKVSFKLWTDDSVLTITCAMYPDLENAIKLLEKQS